MIDDIKRIVKAAGQIVLKAHNISSGIESKQGRANFVTKYDFEVQDFLYQELLKVYPTATFIGEEDVNKDHKVGEYCFVIDPIDGTTNFIFDYKHSAISVALLHDGELVSGVVYNPFLDELFYAEVGKGAFLNSVPLHVQNLSLKEGIVGLGSCPYDRTKTDETFKIARKLFDHALDLRRSGSAALDICYVAAGRFVLYFELQLSPWDYSAATLILREAGGNITTMDQSSLSFTLGSSVVAATPAAYEDFFQLK